MIKYLFVSFPVDFGNTILSRNMLIALRSGADVDCCEFDAGSTVDTSLRTNSLMRNMRRAANIDNLFKSISKAKKEKRIILFQQVSPALFSLPFLFGSGDTFIILDWTRKLYEPILLERMSSQTTSFIHSYVMRRMTKILCFTMASQSSVIHDYGVESSRALRIPMPFDSKTFMPAPARKGTVRLLFVGGDFKRKGGDIVLNWYIKRKSMDIRLTIVTQSKLEVDDDIMVINNVPGEGLQALYADHDLFILPTRCDAYPQVLGEAACAGLGIVTTSTALGAPEIVVADWNGLIASGASEFCHFLDLLILDRERIERFKANSRQRMLENFTFQHTFEAIREATAREQ